MRNGAIAPFNWGIIIVLIVCLINTKRFDNYDTKPGIVIPRIGKLI